MTKSQTYNCENCNCCKTVSHAEQVDKLSKKVLKYLDDWDKGMYEKDSKYILHLAINLQKINVLFQRDIKKKIGE